jgi:hypothetical protein
VTPEQRTARARIAALSVHSRGRTNTRPATVAAEARFLREVIEEAAAAGESLSDADIARRAKAKRSLLFAKLSYASAKARTARARERRGRAAAA